MKVGVVYLYVKDLDRSLNFYRDKLGMKVLKDYREMNSWIELDGDGITIGLNENPERGDSHHPPLGGSIISFIVKDVEAKKKELEDMGVRFVRDVGNYNIVKLTQFVDPDGNLLEIHERI